MVSIIYKTISNTVFSFCLQMREDFITMDDRKSDHIWQFKENSLNPAEQVPLRSLTLVWKVPHSILLGRTQKFVPIAASCLWDRCSASWQRPRSPSGGARGGQGRHFPHFFVLPLHFEFDQEKLGIFMYKIVKTDDFLRIPPPTTTTFDAGAATTHSQGVCTGGGGSSKFWGGRGRKIWGKWGLPPRKLISFGPFVYCL